VSRALQLARSGKDYLRQALNSQKGLRKQKSLHGVERYCEKDVGEKVGGTSGLKNSVGKKWGRKPRRRD